MTDRSPFTRLTRLAPSGVIFLAFILIVGALLLLSGTATQDAALRPTFVPSATAIIGPTTG